MEITTRNKQIDQQPPIPRQRFEVSDQSRYKRKKNQSNKRSRRAILSARLEGR